MRQLKSVADYFYSFQYLGITETITDQKILFLKNFFYHDLLHDVPTMANSCIKWLYPISIAPDDFAKAKFIVRSSQVGLLTSLSRNDREFFQYRKSVREVIFFFSLSLSFALSLSQPAGFAIMYINIYIQAFNPLPSIPYNCSIFILIVKSMALKRSARITVEFIV